MRISFIYPIYLWLLLLLPLTAALAFWAQGASFKPATSFGSAFRGLSRQRFWGSLLLRLLLLLLIIAALSGIQLRLRTAGLTTVFILDVSDSIPPAQRQSGEDFIAQAIQAMPQGDRAAIVLFGKEALVERLASESTLLTRLSSIPISSGTDIASALQLAQAIFPAEGAKRMVLLSDGQENLGVAVDQAELAAAGQIELLYVPLSGVQGETEVYIARLEAPAEVRQGESYPLTALIHASQATNAELRIFADGELIHSQAVRLQSGENRVQVDVDGSQSPSANRTGFRRFNAQVVPEQDTRLQNNQASAFTVVYGPPSILIVEGSPGEGQNMQAALQAAEMQVQRLAPGQMPTTLSELAAYDAILLMNVHAASLPDEAMQALPLFIKDLGKGLLMTGGVDSFGAGGYLRTPLEAALPVDMDVRNRDLQANLALVLAVDKSGSMGRCHCDNPDLNQTYTRAEVGQPKVDIAKEAIMRAASALGNQDFLGVVAFDSAARWVLDLAQLVDPLALEEAIGRFTAEGDTNLLSGVDAAYKALQGVDAKRKHIILMTDGWVHQGDLSTLAQQMQEEGITLSVIAAGSGSAEYLQGLSAMGGGRYYPATDILNVPDIFLKETVQSVGEYIIEDPFYPLPAIPSPVLRGLDPESLPALLGYNGVTSKNTARLDLLTPRGDPLLATWQYGLGRSAAWTSDLKAQWAAEWLRWQDFPRFAAQLVNWLLPAPRVEGLETQASLQNGELVVKMTATGQDGLPLNFLDGQVNLIDPALNSQTLPLEQTGPGQYQVRQAVEEPGVYLLRVGVNQGDQSLGQVTRGVVVPYSPEYLTSGADRGLLEELARRTGGGELLDPLSAFVHNLPAADLAREIWRPLLLLAAILFPLDVAVRRLAISKSDLEKARLWLKDRLTPQPRRATSDQPQLLGRLFEARQRARRRPGSEDKAEQPEADRRSAENAASLEMEKGLKKGRKEPAEPEQTPPSTGYAQPDEPNLGQDEQQDPLARLREAKKRANKK